MTSNVYGGRGPEIVAVGWTFAAVTTLLFACRLYVWFRVTRHGGWALFWFIVAFVRSLRVSLARS